MTMPGAPLPAPATPSSMPMGSQMGMLPLAQDDTHPASILARHDFPVCPLAGSTSGCVPLTTGARGCCEPCVVCGTLSLVWRHLDRGSLRELLSCVHITSLLFPGMVGQRY